MPSEPSAKSGIATTASGERHIPSSTRPDGTLRKEIRVRPGYRPPEDVEVYKNRTAEAWKSRGKGGVPGADWVTEETQRSTPKRSVKKKEARPDASSNGDATGSEKAQNDPSKEEIPVDLEAEKEKEVKKLSKRLRQARDLEQKKVKGDALLPEQFEKVIRINELIRQLDKLGFDADGQPKP